jgi:hypothetical protein
MLDAAAAAGTIEHRLGLRLIMSVISAHVVDAESTSCSGGRRDVIPPACHGRRATLGNPSVETHVERSAANGRQSADGSAYHRQSVQIMQRSPMHWAEEVLPTPVETVVLHGFLLVLSDALPDLAARWLAADVADSPAVRALAGADPHDPWRVEELLSRSIEELDGTVPATTSERRAIAIEWVARTWLRSRDTRQAVSTLSRLELTNLDLPLMLDEFISLDHEWGDLGTWGRTRAELEARATQLLTRILRESPTER